MPALILEQDGQHRGLVLRGTVLIGRDSRCDLPLLVSAVSRCHARVDRGPWGYYIEDAGSRHGTLVNQAPLAGRHLLRHEDLIVIGGLPLRYLDDSALPPGVSRIAPPARRTIAFRCPHCQTILHVPGRIAGTLHRCRACAQSVEVPGAGDQPPRQALPPQPWPTDPAGRTAGVHGERRLGVGGRADVEGSALVEWPPRAQALDDPPPAVVDSSPALRAVRPAAEPALVIPVGTTPVPPSVEVPPGAAVPAGPQLQPSPADDIAARTQAASLPPVPRDDAALAGIPLAPEAVPAGSPPEMARAEQVYLAAAAPHALRAAAPRVWHAPSPFAADPAPACPTPREAAAPPADRAAAPTLRRPIAMAAANPPEPAPPDHRQPAMTPTLRPAPSQPPIPRPQLDPPAALSAPCDPPQDRVSELGWWQAVIIREAREDQPPHKGPPQPKPRRRRQYQFPPPPSP